MKAKPNRTPHKEIMITPLVKSLSGIVKLPANFDFKKEFANHLVNKYK